MKQQYELGLWLRQRYILQRAFLSPNYRQEEVRILLLSCLPCHRGRVACRSTSAPPTKIEHCSLRGQISLDSTAAPPPLSPTVSPGHPSPFTLTAPRLISFSLLALYYSLTTEHSTIFELIRTKSVDCDQYDAIKAREGIDEFPELDAENAVRRYGRVACNLELKWVMQDLYANVSRLSGVSIRTADDLTSWIWDAWGCETAEGLRLPSWAWERWAPDDDRRSVFHRVRDIKTQVRLKPFRHPTLAKLSGGFLLGDLLSRMQRIAAGAPDKDDPTKVVMYSGVSGRACL